MMALSRSKQMLRASLKSIVERGKSRKRKYSPTEVAQLWIKGGFDQDGFEVRHISHDVGRGVFATKSFMLAKSWITLKPPRGKSATSTKGEHDGSCITFAMVKKMLCK